jgi:sugar phosphate isomerase/epimerase
MNDQLGVCPATLLTDAMTPTPTDVQQAAEAASAAGLRGSSFWGFHLQALADHVGGWDALTSLLERLGLPVRAVEAAFAWPAGDEEATRAEAAGLADLARRSGAGIVAAVCMDPALPDDDTARAGLAIVVEEARAAGARVALEFLPWSGIPDLATAWRLVEPLGPDAGILLDSWHWYRQPGGPATELLASIPGERIPYVQVCDAAPAAGPDLMAEAMSARLVPGEGVVDFSELVGILDEIGADPFVAAEVFNPSRLADDGAERFAATTRAGWEASR